MRRLEEIVVLSGISKRAFDKAGTYVTDKRRVGFRLNTMRLRRGDNGGFGSVMEV